MQRIYREVPFGTPRMIKESNIWQRESLKYRVVDTMQLDLASDMSQVQVRGAELPICIDR